MSRTILLDKATIITAGKECKGSVLISEGYIAEVMYADDESYDELVRHALQACPDAEVIDLEGKWLMAGGIDAHVHFREPGLTHKADMATESAAAELLPSWICRIPFPPQQMLKQFRTR